MGLLSSLKIFTLKMGTPCILILFTFPTKLTMMKSAINLSYNYNKDFLAIFGKNWWLEAIHINVNSGILEFLGVGIYLNNKIYVKNWRLNSFLIDLNQKCPKKYKKLELFFKAQSLHWKKILQTILQPIFF